MPEAEPFEIAARDGWRVRGEVRAPERPRAVAIAGHAMMVDRRTLDRPRGEGLVSSLVARGVAVVVPDLRGHGQSGPRADEGGLWTYDDLVADVTPLIDFAREKFSGLRCVAVGHSLFGHVTLAQLARAPSTPLDGLVMLACNICHPLWRRRPISWASKVVLIEAMRALVAMTGRFPSRRLSIGSDDEAGPYVRQFSEWWRAGDWCALDGFSYWDALGAVRTPIYGVVGAGDRLMSPAADMRDLVTRVPGARFEIVGRKSGLAIDPGHMGLVLDARCRPVWERVADFILDGN